MLKQKPNYLLRKRKRTLLSTRTPLPSPTILPSPCGLIENINELIASRQVRPNPKTNPAGFFYIIQTADVADNVYKVGKTRRLIKRMGEYPKYSLVKYTIAVSDCHAFEAYALRKFRLLFKRRREYGLEYFEGDLTEMINLAHKLWNKFVVGPISINKNMEKIKPKGFQYFVNEYYSKRNKPSLTESYDMYVSMMKDTFMTDIYADKYTFIMYLNYMLDA